MYKEVLPENCPTSDSEDIYHPKAYRMPESSVVSDEDFHSHAKKGKKRLERYTHCEWSGCSFFSDFKEIVEYQRSNPKLRKKFKYIAEIEITKGSGRSSKIDKKTHFNFWAYEGFDFVQAVKNVVAIGGINAGPNSGNSSS
ncbi:MAG: hypothetical protein O9342_00240 [Beijerinckiaceae bacterium]|nr:hypothetical protein [Beijerinckiaceae bacterium]